MVPRRVREEVRIPVMLPLVRAGVWERVLLGIRVWVVVWQRVLAVGRSRLRILIQGESRRPPEPLLLATMNRSTTTIVRRPSAIRGPEFPRSSLAPSHR